MRKILTPVLAALTISFPATAQTIMPGGPQLFNRELHQELNSHNWMQSNDVPLGVNPSFSPIVKYKLGEKPAIPLIPLQRKNRKFNDLMRSGSFANSSFVAGFSTSSKTYGDYFHELPPKTRNEIYLKELLPDLSEGPPPSEKQVLPGQSVDDPSGPQMCLGPSCLSTSRRLAFVGMPAIGADAGKGPKCPKALCIKQPPTVFGCAGPLCKYPPKQMLSVNPITGFANINYARSGFPEVVFMRTRFLQDGSRKPECSATALAPEWVMTALHCIARTPKALKTLFTETPSSAAGWTRLTVRSEYDFGFDFLNSATGEAAIEHSILIPYQSINDIKFAAKGVPNKDIALIRLQAGGFRLKDHHLAELRFDGYPSADKAISFSGFGWTNIAKLYGPDWDHMANDARWKALKQSAFNFIEKIVQMPHASHPLIRWQNGNLGGNGGPCSYDSGGPVYAGFNRGYWNNPREILGVVSGLNAGDAAIDDGITSADQCRAKRNFAVAEMVANYKDGICALVTPKPRSC